MNILLINHYAGSKEYGMEFRPYYLAKEWVKQGHQITIVGASFSHLRMKNPEIKTDYSSEIIDGIRYIWFKTPSYSSSASRIFNMLVFIRKLYKYSRKIVEDVKPNLVIASSTYPLDNYPAYKIAQSAGAQYTYEIHDLWPLSPMLIGGYFKYHPFIWIMQQAEDYAYKHVDKVVSLLWNAEEHCKERGLKQGKFVCVPNGYNPEEWSDEKFALPLPEEHQNAFERLNGKIIVGFAGGFAASGSVDTLVSAAAYLKERNDIHIVLVGKGPEKAKYERIITENSLKNVSILPPVPKSLIPAIVSHFDIAAICGVHSSLHKYGTSPNKLTDYMLSSKPVIYTIDEPGCLVERVGCGVRVEAENAVQLAKAIDKLTKYTPEERAEIGKRGKDYALTHLKWETLAEDFINAFK